MLCLDESVDEPPGVELSEYGVEDGPDGDSSDRRDGSAEAVQVVDEHFLDECVHDPVQVTAADHTGQVGLERDMHLLISTRYRD